MSATEELRRLLDERGVEHYDGTKTTLWGYEPTSESTGAYRVAADEISSGRMQVRMFNVTPEQAVDATLGKGTCQFIDEDNFNETEWCDAYSWFRCSACGWTFDECDRWLTTMSYCPNCGRKVVG